jgi:hypothetical protein
LAGKFISWPAWALTNAFASKLTREIFPSTPETLHDAFSAAGAKAREIEELMAAFELVDSVLQGAESIGVISPLSTGLRLTVSPKDHEAYLSLELTTPPLGQCSCGFAGVPKRIILNWPQSLLGSLPINYLSFELSCDFGITRRERLELLVPAFRQVKEAIGNTGADSAPKTAAKLVEELVSRILPALVRFSETRRLCGC